MIKTSASTRSSRSSRSLFQPFLVLLCLLLSSSFGSALATSSKTFPSFPEIEAGVRFWEKIYSTHSINSAVIHDRDDLSKVYEVIRLLPKDQPMADKINAKVMKTTVTKYEKILTSLSQGKQPQTNTEKSVASMFQHGGRKAMKKAAANVRAQTGLKERFREGVIRSGAYMQQLQHLFTSKGLPAELAYLPHVESSFNTEAYSKFGAAGMWQFTRATGKQYLNINEVIDERRDPILAGEAAAQYLKNSYNLLGSWPLALTAYNYGTAGMLRAQKANGSYVRIHKEYAEGHFGFASRNFYPEFLAALHVAQQLEQDPSVHKNPTFSYSEFVLPGFVHIKKIRSHFGLSTATLKKYNPALRPPVYDEKKLIPRGYPLRLPPGSRYTSLIATFPRGAFNTAQIEDAFYRVQRGDTAGAIAARHKVRLKDLIRLNHLDSSARINVGQRLRIPAPAATGKTSLPPYISAEQQKRFPGHAGSLPAPVPATPILTASKKKTLTPVAQEGVHNEVITVHPEESLSLYALWLKVDEKTLRAANTLSATDAITPGQSLTVEYSRVSAAEFADQRAEYARETEEEFFSEYTVSATTRYLVKKGDTLWDLCVNRFAIPLWLLQKYNPDIDLTRIHPQQELEIPIVKAR